MRPAPIIALALVLSAAGLSRAADSSGDDRFSLGDITPKGIRRGPLQLSADETVSRDHAKLIDAKGHVKMRYEMESGDVLRSFSEFAHYDDRKKTGEVYGNPRAIWNSIDPKEPETDLTAEKILVDIQQESLSAYGHVVVTRASSTLTAEEMHFSNPQKKLTALGGRPVFEVRQPDQHTRITSEEVVAWTDRRQIHFDREVRGTVDLLEAPKGLK